MVHGSSAGMLDLVGLPRDNELPNKDTTCVVRHLAAMRLKRGVGPHEVDSSTDYFTSHQLCGGRCPSWGQ